jgi:uncharacterized protein YhbP (UPF0306 family)
MNDDQTKQKITEYLPSVIHMTLASTGQGGKPWATEVHYAYDDDLNLYWASMQDARHSREVAANPQVAGTIVKQHGPDDAPLGVSFEGVAEVLHNIDERHPAFQVYVARLPKREGMIRAAYADKTDTGLRIYKVKVTDWYLNGLIDGKMQKRRLAWK